jgi:hypothetical protein
MNRLLFVAFLSFPTIAHANDAAWLARAINSAKSASVVDVPAGDYDLKDFRIAKSITLRGSPDGKTVFRSAEVTDKGILVPQAGVDLRVENISFEGAKSWDRNGAGIRHEGRNLVVVNCRFLGNEDGILATGDERGEIVIDRSLFEDSGFGDGQSHAIYVSSGARLEVVGSRFYSTRIGHHVKSLAGRTIVRASTLDDGYGRTSYAIDASRGGDLIVENNNFVQSRDSDNHAIINYDLTRGGAASMLVIRGNAVVNLLDGGVFLRNDTKLAPVMTANRIESRGKKPLAVVSPGSPKPIER